MKKTLTTLAVLALLAGSAMAQQTTVTVKDVRNPRKLAAVINANAADVDARVLGTTNSSTLALVNQADAGTAQVTLQADRADDAGDKYGIVATDGAGLAIQSDASSKGTLATKVTISAAGGIAAADAITLTDASGAAAISAIAASGAYDATLTLDADAGEDNGDTWIIESEAADNDLSFVNHTTEAMKLTTAGALTATDDITCDKIIFTDAATAAPTNSASQGFLVTVNGTNYWLALYPVND